MTNAYQLPQTSEEVAAYLASFDRQVALGIVLLPVYDDEHDR